MKRPLTLLLLLFFLVFGASFLATGFSYASDEEKIENFEATIRLNEDSSINISEKIEYDFGANSKHGIFRNIPVKYQRSGLNYNLRVENISVADENRHDYSFQGSFSGNNIILKIGDPNKYVSRKKTYIINYDIKGVINYFTDHDEFYWNVTGNDWTVNIEKAKAIVILPQSITETALQRKCFRGKYGSQDSCALINFTPKPNNSISDIEFGEFSVLSAGEGLSVLLGLPKNIIRPPSSVEFMAYILADNWGLAIPFISLAVLSYLWYSRGRDPKGRGTIIAEYDAPDNLMPAEVGTIIDEKANDKDVSAEIISLAVRGYLKITRTETPGLISKFADYTFDRLKDDETRLAEFDRKIMHGLFPASEKHPRYRL